MTDPTNRDRSREAFRPDLMNRDRSRGATSNRDWQAEMFEDPARMMVLANTLHILSQGPTYLSLWSTS
ncbi:hypothetical protein DVH05_025706 [Phytophthora capsici]|nr:hypothetical protein DVH05_025706 [Phytophthora capsici]